MKKIIILILFTFIYGCGFSSIHKNQKEISKKTKNSNSEGNPAPCLRLARGINRALVIPRGVFPIDLGCVDDCHDPEWQTTAKGRENRPNQTIVRLGG